MLGSLDGILKQGQRLGLSPGNARLPQNINDGGVDSCVGTAPRGLHGLKGVQRMAPLPALQAVGRTECEHSAPAKATHNQNT